MSAFITQRRVEFANTDMAGIVHYANFYYWMEEAEHEYFRSLGLSIMEQLPDGQYIGWPRVSASCHFESPAFHEDILEIRVRVERIGFKSLTFFTEFFREDKRLAYGRMKIACCLCGGEDGLKSIEIPESYRSLIQEMPAEK